jgi:hypothetical protein
MKHGCDYEIVSHYLAIGCGQLEFGELSNFGRSNKNFLKLHALKSHV